MNQFTAIDTYQWSLILQKVQLLHNCTNVYIIVPMLTYKKVPMSTKRSIILQKVQLLHNCTSVYIIVPMLTYKKIHFVYKKDTALVCHPLPFCKIWRRHVWDGKMLINSICICQNISLYTQLEIHGMPLNLNVI